MEVVLEVGPEEPLQEQVLVLVEQLLIPMHPLPPQPDVVRVLSISLTTGPYISRAA